jgi:hypothetical protein
MQPTRVAQRPLSPCCCSSSFPPSFFSCSGGGGARSSSRILEDESLDDGLVVIVPLGHVAHVRRHVSALRGKGGGGLTAATQQGAEAICAMRGHAMAGGNGNGHASGMRLLARTRQPQLARKQGSKAKAARHRHRHGRAESGLPRSRRWKSRDRGRRPRRLCCQSCLHPHRHLAAVTGTALARAHHTYLRLDLKQARYQGRHALRVRHMRKPTSQSRPNGFDVEAADERLDTRRGQHHDHQAHQLPRCSQGSQHGAQQVCTLRRRRR